MTLANTVEETRRPSGDPIAERADWPRRIALAAALGLVALPPALLSADRLLAERVVPPGLAVLIVTAAFVVAARDVRRLGPLTVGPTRWSWSWLGLALLGVTLGGFWIMPAIGAWALMVLIPAIAFARGGPTLLRAVLPAWSLLWFLVPPVPTVLTWLDGRLLASAAQWTSDLLEERGIFHVLDGDLLRLDAWTLRTGGVLDGWGRSVTVLGLSAVYTRLRNGRWSRLGLMLIAGLGWSWLGMLLRLMVPAVAWAERGVDVTQGPALGPLVFAAVVVLQASTYEVVGLLISGWRLFSQAWRKAWRRWWVQRAAKRALWEGNTLTPEEYAAEVMETVAITPAAVGAEPTLWTPLRESILGRPLCWALAGAIGVGLCIWLAPCFPRTFGPIASFPEASFRALSLDSMPDTLRGGRRIGFLADDFGPLSDQGEYRRSWRYEFGTAEVVASVAFPFQEGNEPTAALRREGWVATRRAIEEDEQGRRLVLDVEDGKGAHACFLQKDVRPGDHEEGAAPGLVARLQVWRPETRRWLLGRYRRPAGYVLEVLVIAEAPLADQGRDEARRFLADFENALKTQATGRPSPWGPS